MTIKTKIILLGLLAIASLSYILGVRVVSGTREHEVRIQFLIRLHTAEGLSALVHELQKERGLSAGYLALQSARNTELLHAQRVATTQARARLEGVAGGGSEYLSSLDDTRRDISTLRMSAAGSFGYYSQTILEIIDRIDALTRDASTTRLARDLHAHVHLVYAKEYLGQIRALINEALSEGRIDRERVAAVVRQLSLHQLYRGLVIREASPDTARAMNTALGQPKATQTYDAIDAVVSGASAPLTAEEWFAMSTHTIDKLLTVESGSLAYLRQQAREEIAVSERRLWLDVGITLAAALALILFAASAVRGLLRALNVLITNIEHTVRTQDFSHRIELHSNDEMGVISHNFNELIAIAEHLIKEKDYFASTDLLTGAYNRYRFTELFEIELQRITRYGGSLALIMFDIDHFKDINDDCGHTAGDMVLKAIAHRIRDLIRASDVLVRWGGEEFMILVPHTGEQAVDLAEKLRDAIERNDFKLVPKVTASFGVAAYRPGDTLETLYARTDEALYRAKHQGRNRVCGMEAEAAAV